MVGMLKYVFLGLFIAVMILVGIISRKKIQNVQDFFLGGRKMGPWLSAFAYGTTYFSAVIFIGYAGKTGWGFGISATFIGIGNALLGSLLAWLVLAKRTRRMTHELGAATMPEFFEKRYDSKAMKIATALIIFVFLVPYSASVPGACISVRDHVRRAFHILHGGYGSADRHTCCWAVMWQRR